MRAQGRCLLLHADEGRCSLVLRRLPARFGRARSHSSGTRFAAGCFPVGRSTRPRGIQADVRQMVTRAAAGCLISPSLPARQPPANIARTVRDRRACGVGRDHACPFGRGALRSAGCAPSSMDCARMFVVHSLGRPRALLLYGRDSIPSDATDGLDRRPASGWRVDKGCGRCGNGRPGTGVANCEPPFERHAWRSEAPIPRSQNGCFTWNIGRPPAASVQRGVSSSVAASLAPLENARIGGYGRQSLMTSPPAKKVVQLHRTRGGCGMSRSDAACRQR